MKIKVIKKAEIDSLGKKQESTPKILKRRRVKRAVEKWVAEVRAKSEAETHISIDSLFPANRGSST